MWLLEVRWRFERVKQVLMLCSTSGGHVQLWQLTISRSIQRPKGDRTVVRLLSPSLGVQLWRWKLRISSRDWLFEVTSRRRDPRKRHAQHESALRESRNEEVSNQHCED